MVLLVAPLHIFRVLKDAKRHWVEGGAGKTYKRSAEIPGLI